VRFDAIGERPPRVSRTAFGGEKGAHVSRDDLCYEFTVSLARRIRTREVSPLEAVNAYIERIERVDPQVRLAKLCYGHKGRNMT
jgi:hypothetical protein